MARAKGIIAYGTDDDRLRLEAVAKLESKSSSQWIIDAIRQRFRDVYGDTQPTEVVKK